MPVNNDIVAKEKSRPNPWRHRSNLLDGSRWGFEANQDFVMPEYLFDEADSESVKTALANFVEKHYNNQVERLITLERYYQGESDIHFWNSERSPYRADNRVANNIARYITNVRVGYQFGNPIKYGFSDPDDPKNDGHELLDTLTQFNNRNDEPYHNKIMGQDLCNTGRAYELMYVKQGTNQVVIKRVDPVNAFVVYGATVEHNPLFGVRYFLVSYNNIETYHFEAYTENYVYYFESQNSPIATMTEESERTKHNFDGVPLVEYSLNDERIGLWEPNIDMIDALDKSTSEMTNSQENIGNAILVVTGINAAGGQKPLLDGHGNPVTNENGEVMMIPTDIDPKLPVMQLEPSVIDVPGSTPIVVQPKAEYLTKSLDPQGWKIFTDMLISSIHKYTNTPDVNDEKFSGNASGVAMSYKLWGADQERSIQQSMFNRGLSKRITLLFNYLRNSKKKDVLPELVDNITKDYTPNLPKNDKEVAEVMVSLAKTGDFSAHTLRKMGEVITGTPADREDTLNEEEQNKDANDIKEMTRKAKTGGDPFDTDDNQGETDSKN